jgi:hypothetical protein
MAAGAAWCGAGARVALGGIGWPQRIRADWLWPRRHVATRAPPEPVQAAATLSARSNAYKENGGADRPRRRRVPRRLGVWPAWGDCLDSLGLLVSEGTRSVAGGRRGASGAGAGTATTTRRWRRLPTQCGNEQTCRFTECARQRARKVGTGWCSGYPRRMSRRGLRWSAACRHGRRGAQRSQFTREGLRRAARCVRGDQGRGVLPHPQLAMRCKVPGHGEDTAARVS